MKENTNRKNRNRCPRCGGTMKVRRTIPREREIVRYRYCAKCSHGVKSVENISQAGPVPAAAAVCAK